MSKRILGSKLTPADRQTVLTLFINRYTKEHLPQWVLRSSFPCPVHFASDADWLAHTTFAVCACGALDRRSQTCESRPTWPCNPEWRSASEIPFNLLPPDEYEDEDEI